MSLCFHTYVSELAKVLQSKVAQSKSKWKEKIPLIVSASVIQWKLQKVSFQGELAEKMILQAKAIEVIHSTIWYTYSVHLKKKKLQKMKSIICSIILISPKDNIFFYHAKLKDVKKINLKLQRERISKFTCE